MMLTSVLFSYSLEMAICYLLHSKGLNKFYIGFTADILEKRIEKHNMGFYGVKKYTHRTNDWELFFSITSK